MTTLRVMTFNIRGSYHRDGKNAWRHRADLSARIIKSHAPDVIGFQEFQKGNRRFFETHLPGYERSLGPEYENYPPRSRNAIYWNPERLQLRDNGGFWLSETPEVFSGSWNTHQKRSVNWARFRISSTSIEFLHLNTHLDHRSVEARRQGAKLIVGWLETISSEDLPIIVTGDFNADPNSPVHRTFTDAGYADVHLLANSPSTRTFHKFQGDSFAPRRPEKEGRLDWILVRGAYGKQRAEVSCHVVRDAEPPVYPSDHYPVFADLSLEDNGPLARLT